MYILELSFEDKYQKPRIFSGYYLESLRKIEEK